MDILLKFNHGLGDAVQLSCVVQHLAKYRPGWTVDVASQIGKHSAFHGQCHRSWILDREPIPEREYGQVFDLGWYECYSVYADSPCTKVCNCLREVFGIAPDISLLKYRIDVRDQAITVTRRYLAQICDGRASPQAEDRFPVVAIHYQGNTSVDKKNLAHWQIAALCNELVTHGYTPLILDWDRRSPLPDQTRIFCPGVGPGDLWDNTGTGDTERLAALISQCALMIGIDSGPLHVAGATETPTLGVWTGHSPVQFYDLCPNVTHLVPEQWRVIPPCQHSQAAQFFTEHYAYRTYRGVDDLESALIETALETLDKTAVALVAGPINLAQSPLDHAIRAPPLPENSRQASASHRITRSQTISTFHAQQDLFPKETLMTTTTAMLAWEQLPGLAHEIALGADGSAWCLGTGEMPGGGYSIHRWNGADWDHIDGAAVKIAVGPDGSVWAVNRAHQVLWNAGAGWIVLPGLAREIACGADGSVWCLSAAEFAPGGGSIHVWNGHDWDHVEGAAVKIAISPDGQAWIVNSAGQIFRQSGEGWELLPGLAAEIACDGEVWCLSSGTSADGEHSIHIWNGTDWEHVSGGAVKIAAGTGGTVMLINAQNQIFKGA